MNAPLTFKPMPAGCAPVEGVARYRGFTLVYYGNEPRRGRYENLAVRNFWGDVIDLDVSRWNFHPTDERFRWLVDNTFPTRADFGQITPLTDALIDARIRGAIRCSSCGRTHCSCSEAKAHCAECNVWLSIDESCPHIPPFGEPA